MSNAPTIQDTPRVATCQTHPRNALQKAFSKNGQASPMTRHLATTDPADKVTRFDGPVEINGPLTVRFPGGGSFHVGECGEYKTPSVMLLNRLGQPAVVCATEPDGSGYVDVNGPRGQDSVSLAVIAEDGNRGVVMVHHPDRDLDRDLAAIPVEWDRNAKRQTSLGFSDDAVHFYDADGASRAKMTFDPKGGTVFRTMGFAGHGGIEIVTEIHGQQQRSFISILSKDDVSVARLVCETGPDAYLVLASPDGNAKVGIYAGTNDDGGHIEMVRDVPEHQHVSLFVNERGHLETIA